MVKTSNNPKKVNLSGRQASILAAIVKEYTDNPEPVGSQDLNQKYHFNVSPATIRSEMVVLEKLGYIEQPHTSAGRVPTDAGYRYFVKELMKRFELSLKEQKFLHEQLAGLQKQHQELGRNIAKLLAARTDQAAFALLPESSSSSGLSNILNQPNVDKEKFTEVVEFFEKIDEYGDDLIAKYIDNESATLIGEKGLSPIKNYSMIVSRVTLPSGKKGVIGIIGPKSMRYDKNISLVEYIAKMLSGGILVILAMQIKY